jgi:lipoate-protein ligase A
VAELLQFSHAEAGPNLALEEVLLAPMVKTIPSEPLIRVWENQQRCIVLGRAEKADQQIFLEEAQRQNVTVLRRTSGGGTVVHGPGNLNLSFFLPYHMDDRLKSIHDSYQLIIGWVRTALKDSCGVETNMNGSSDISIGDLKISGTAQARKRHGLLHHLTLLIDFDLQSIANLLKEPEKRPDYRGQREHRQFVTTLKQQGFDWDLDAFLDALSAQIGPWTSRELSEGEQQHMAHLGDVKYGQPAWNLEGSEPSREDRTFTF